MEDLAAFIKQNPYPTPKALEEYEKRVKVHNEQRRKKRRK